ncbi:MAG: ATP-grasp domain-containing protein [Candidatus Dormibacteria bacterium]
MSRAVLLVLPTRTYRAAAFLAAARRLALEVVVASEDASTLGHLHPERELVVDFLHPEEAADRVARLVGAERIQAVVAADEAGVIYAARLAEALGVGGNSPAAAAATRDKAQLRRLLAARAIPQPRWALWAAGAPPPALGFPAVVKPLDQAASRGVIRVEDELQLTHAGRRIRTMLAEDPDCPADHSQADLLVEEFIAGPEVAVEALLLDGELQPLAIYDKPEPLDGPYFEESIYTVPTGLAPDRRAQVWNQLQSAVWALGLGTGPVHAEFRLGQGQPRLIDLASRSIGGRCSTVLHFRSGATLEELILLNALGEQLPDVGLEEGGAGVMMLPVPGPGTLLAVAGRDDALAVPGIEGLEITVPIGRAIAGPPEGDRYLGFLFSRAADGEAAARVLRAAQARLRIEVAP